MGIKVSSEHVQACMDGCASSGTRTDLLKAMDSVFKSIGAETFSYHYLPHIADEDHAAGKITHIGVPKSDWTDYYISQYRDVRSPVQTFCLRKGRAFSTRDLLTNDQFQSESSQAYLKKAIPRIGHGIIIPIFGADNSRGMVFLYAPNEEKTPRDIDFFLVERMCFLFHRKYAKLSKKTARNISLTPREREVLQHLPLGRSNREISGILGVSQSTVNDYVRSLFLKLDVSDRVTASLKAFMLDLIE